jgi:hypothetical protein
MSTAQTQSIHRFPAEARGGADFGWLKANYAFSFARWYNPERMGFGKLRVLNDDYIAGGTGFPSHPHENMEIVTIILEGALRHEDSSGHSGTVRPGDVQIMSAGTGIFHSERNAQQHQTTNVLQTWVEPKAMNIEPRYDQQHFDLGAQRGALVPLVSPDPDDAGTLWINQDARFHRGWLNAGQAALTYEMHGENMGVYLFVIEGEVAVAGTRAGRRDALEITGLHSFDIHTHQDADVLLIETPMT